ncbi:MAG: BMP family protein [Fimbriimonadaceae bacterium]|nr:BMP family protein [Fimbriimonadaceae bacterium]
MNQRAFLLSALAALVLIGCSAPAGKPSGEAPKEEPFKVALLTPGPVSDAGWSAMAYEGLMAIKDELGAEVNNQEAGGTQIKDAMRSYARQGYKLIFGHGFEYNEPGMEVGKDFPDTVFVSSSGGQTATNVGAFRFYLEQGFYLAGAMAGKMSKSGVVGMVGGDDVPSIRSTFKAFRAGVLAANPNAKVQEVFTGNGQDPAKAKQATEQMIAAGADFVIHQANAAAQGVFDACKEKGAYAFGANADQNANPSGAVIASAIIVGKPAFVALAKQVKEGTFKGGIALMGMDKGAIDFVVNPAMAAKVPADVTAYVDELRKQIVDGKLTVPKDEF